jgi:disulfide bond formation protein DsbB
MTRDVVYLYSGLGVAGQVLIAGGLLVGLLALAGVRTPLATVRRWLWGYELWGAFVVAALATGGSLFYSQVENFIPCELCWYQRLLMYPLSILTLLLACRGDYRGARYILPLPVVGAGVSIYHMLIQYGAIKEPTACSAIIPGLCGTNWIAREGFGYLAIPTLALTGFLVLIGFLLLASSDEADEDQLTQAEA